MRESANRITVIHGDANHRAATCVGVCVAGGSLSKREIRVAVGLAGAVFGNQQEVTPVAGSVVCNQVRKAIKDGIPIEVENLSVCGDKGYTPGAVGYAGMQQQRAEDQDYDFQFSTCKTPCNALIITGPIGFDLTTRDNIAIKKAAKK